MEIKRSKIAGSINLGKLGELELRILGLDFLDNWVGGIRVVSKAKSFRNKDGKVRNYSNKQVMLGIRSLIDMRLLETR